MDERRVESVIKAEEAGQELLAWLARRFTYSSAGRWKAFIEEGRFRVNGSAAGAELILAAGDLVSFSPPLGTEPEVDLSYRIVHEAGGFIVVDKPAGLPCHPSGRFFSHTLWRLLLEGRPMVHVATRLDRETSGLLLACSSKEAARAAQEQQDAGRIVKEYRAVVRGAFPGRVEARGSIGLDAQSAVRKKQRFFPGEEGRAGAKDCATDFALVAREGGLSEVSCRLLTGRTHQIRATLLALGYPLLGDKLYGEDESIYLRFGRGAMTEADGVALALGRQALHCSALSFDGPGGERLSFASEPPWNLAELARGMGAPR